jgi:hypothetical protein
VIPLVALDAGFDELPRVETRAEGGLRALVAVGDLLDSIGVRGERTIEGGDPPWIC